MCFSLALVWWEERAEIGQTCLDMADMVDTLMERLRVLKMYSKEDR